VRRNPCHFYCNCLVVGGANHFPLNLLHCPDLQWRQRGGSHDRWRRSSSGDEQSGGAIEGRSRREAEAVGSRCERRKQCRWWSHCALALVRQSSALRLLFLCVR
jgi:hypothetical protein